MGWFFKKKGPDVIDLSEKLRKQQEKAAEMQSEAAETSTSSSGAIGIFGMPAANSTPSSSSTSSGYADMTSGSSVEEKRRKLAKRLMDMTEKIEDLSNQIYHLQQRIDVLEKKDGSSGSGSPATGSYGVFG